VCGAYLTWTLCRIRVLLSIVFYYGLAYFFWLVTYVCTSERHTLNERARHVAEPLVVHLLLLASLKVQFLYFEEIYNLLTNLFSTDLTSEYLNRWIEHVSRLEREQCIYFGHKCSTFCNSVVRSCSCIR